MKSSTTFRRAIGLAVLVLLVLGVSAQVAAAPPPAPTATEVINFSTGDPAADPGTEGIAVAADGTIYVSANTAGGGQIWAVAPGATSPQVVATLIPPTGGAGFGVLGLHLDGDDLLVAVNTFADPDLNGVWRVDPASGAATHISGTEAIVLPNDVTTWGGNIYVTDSISGAVWIITAEGDVEPWLQSDLLAGLGVAVPGVPIGANGIDAFGGRLYIANLEKSLIVEVRINGHGPGAEPTVLATVNGFPDGVEIDHRGRPHTVLIDRAQLVRIEADGSSTVLAGGVDVFDAPASLAFGQRRDHKSIYVVNFSIGETFPDVFLQSDLGPGVVVYR